MLIIILLLVSFHIRSNWSLKSEVSSDLQNFLADFNCTMIRMVWIFPLISSLLNLFTRTVPSAASLIGITITFMFYKLFHSLARSWYLSSFLFSLIFTFNDRNPVKDRFLFSCWLKIVLIFWLGLGYLFVSQSLRVFYSFHFLGQILVCACTIYQYGQISISCTIFSWLPFLPNHATSDYHLFGPMKEGLRG